MFRSTPLLPLLFAALVVTTTPACATGMLYPPRYPVGDRDDRAYYNRGVEEGREAGADDARRGRVFDVRRHGEYRNNRRGDDRGDLRAYRQGFEQGYEEAYRRYSRRDDDRRPSPPPPPRSQGPAYGDRDRDRGERSGSVAADTGYRDGIEEGRRAARNRERFDPVRAKRYREGDHDYDRRYGSLDDYKRAYRDAFRRGYDEGYRN